MGEYPQGILANIQKSDTDMLHYQRTTGTGRLPINLESLHQVASRLRESPYAERHVRWCERSETRVGRKLLRFPPTRFICFVSNLSFIMNYKNWINRKPSITETPVAIIPGIINEWFSMYLPILVVPVLSKLIAATTVG